MSFLGERIVAAWIGIYLFDELPIGRATHGCYADPSLGPIGYGPSTSLSRGDLIIAVPFQWSSMAGATLLMGFEPVDSVAGTSPLCIGGPLLRLGPGTLVNTNGTRYWRIGAYPFFGALTPGTTAYFQYWSPDPGGAPGGRVTHSIALTFAP